MCVSGDRSVDSEFLGSPQRLAVNSACECVSVVSRSEFNVRRSYMGGYAEPPPLGWQ